MFFCLVAYKITILPKSATTRFTWQPQNEVPQIILLQNTSLNTLKNASHLRMVQHVEKAPGDGGAAK